MENAVLKIDVVKKESIINYKGAGDRKTEYLKIYTLQPQMVPTMKGWFERGFNFQGIGFSDLTYESNMPYALRFMIDLGIVGAGWIKIPQFMYTLRPVNKHISRCTMEFDADYTVVEPLKLDGPFALIAPLRMMSLDIECVGSQGFPQPERDPVITIACSCKLHTSQEDLPKVIFQLGTCSSIPGVDIRTYTDEKDLLMGFQEFLTTYDPDFLLGYNSVNFDLPYLLKRGQSLGMKKYGFWGRIKLTQSRIKKSRYLSKAMGMRETEDLNMEGRVHLDIMIHMMKETKLSSYSLNSVAYKFLGEQKEDVHYSIMKELFQGTEETRRRIASYCLKDAVLPLKLMEKLMCLYNYGEMARVTGVPVTYLLTRGQQIKVASQLYRKAAQFDMIIPTQRKTVSSGKFEGAFVLEPVKGFYEVPIATLDFASLYPSIMIAHNLCYSTLVEDYGLIKSMGKDEITATPTQPINYHFVTPNVRKGLLPMILEELLSARKKARVELARASDPFVKAVLDGRQLALKISANSVYGFTGAQVGQLPCIQISSSVTAFGREMILKTQSKVLETYTISNGYQFNSQVIYGDTDSVMVKFGVSTVEEAMKLGKEAATEISKEFKAPIKLEFEKVYYPYLLLKKKHYAGLFWTKTDKHDKLDTKGLETVRRDNCLLLRTMMGNVLDRLLIKKDPKDAIEYTRGMIADLLQNRLDIGLLVISRAISKKTDNGEEEENDFGKSNTSKENDKGKRNFSKQSEYKKEEKKPANQYKARLAHVELAEKMRKRDPANAPNIGDRIPYVIVCGSKGSKNYENAEDPIYAMEHDLPIDYNYYIEKQIKPPLLRIFSAVVPNPESIFSGEHTRSMVSQKTSSVVGIGKFAKVMATCTSCRVPVASGKMFCQNCSSKKEVMQGVYLRKMFEYRALQKSYGSLWTECQRCQGNLHADVLCVNRDCPIFYHRKKVQKDIKAASETIKKFNDKNW